MSTNKVYLLWIAGSLCLTWGSFAVGGPGQPVAIEAELVADRYYYWCIEAVIAEMPPVFEIPEDLFPIGCEVIDCCPGCPGDDPLDLHIRLGRGLVETVELRFENLPPSQIDRVKLAGNARRSQDGRIYIGRGDALIQKLDPGPGGRARMPGPGTDPGRFDADRDIKGRAPVLAVKPKIDIAAAKAFRSRADAHEIKVPFVIELKLGEITVNEFVVFYVFRKCWFWPPRQDRIDLDNNAANDTAVVLLDGRRGGGCVNDEIRRGQDIINVGNVLSPQSCNCEVAVFSDDDAMQLVENVTAWTNALGDTLPVDLTPDALVVPVTVWLLRANALATAQQDIAQAELLYNSSNCGVVFAANYNDESNNQAAVNLVGTNPGPMCGGTWLNNLQTSNFYQAGRLNVYYVNGAFTALNCIYDRNVSVVGTQANNQSLAHEFGHAFSLGHTNNIASIPNTNVMHGGGAGRTNFTEAQCFRCNVNTTSVLNTNGVRTGPTRNCPDGTSSDRCPDLALDPSPN